VVQPTTIAGEVMLKKSLLISATAVLSASIATPVLAQVDDDEVIVTATKREQTLQEVPIAVTVTSALTLEQATILDINDLQTVVPSLRISQLQNAGATNFSIRGFGNGANNAGIEPSVGVFIDGVYRSRSGAQIGDLPVTERVEVLRGPQSSLFGKNASVGVISVVTKKPSFDPTGNFEVTYGNFNQVRAKGYYSQGVGDRFAYAISGGFNKRDGFSESLNPDIDDLNDRNRFNLRGDALFQFDDTTELRLIADYSEIDELCCVAVLTDAITGAPPVVNGIPAGGPLNGQALLGALGNPAAAGLTLSQPLAFNDPNDPFSFTNNINTEPVNEITDFGFSAQLDKQIENLDVTAIVSYRENENFANIDADFSNIDFLGSSRTSADIGTFTAELRLNSTAFDERLNWTLGGYYFDETVNTNDGLLFGVDTRAAFEFLGAAGLAAASATPIDIPGAQQTLIALEATNGLTPGSTFFAADTFTDEVGNLDNQAFSIFGSADFDVTDRFTLTLGAAYTKDDKDFSINQQNTNIFSQLDFTDFSVVGPALIGGGLQATLPGAIQAQLAGGFPGFTTLAGSPVPLPFTPENVALITATPQGAAAFAAFQQAVIDGTTAAVTQGVTNAVLGSDLTSAAANPFLGLQALQVVGQSFGLPNAFEENTLSDDEVTFTVRGAYDVSDNINVYASYSTGFKASSVNLSRDSSPNIQNFVDSNGRPIAAAFQTLPNNVTARTTTGQLIDNETQDADIAANAQLVPALLRGFGTRFAAPEETTNIEIGLKAKFETWAINLTAFDLTVDGFQSNAFTGSGFSLLNAGEQSSRGIEWDIIWSPTEALDLTFGGIYLDANFDDFQGSTDLFGASADITGQTPSGIHPLSLTGSATYTHGFQNGWEGFIRGDFAYDSNTAILDAFESINQSASTVAAGGGTVPISSLTGFANLEREQLLVNGGIGLDFDNGFALQGFVRNLTNDQFLQSSFGIPGLGGLFAGYPNQPRTYGITGRYSF